MTGIGMKVPDTFPCIRDLKRLLFVHDSPENKKEKRVALLKRLERYAKYDYLSLLYPTI
jgi:hypothetical protein